MVVTYMVTLRLKCYSLFRVEKSEVCKPGTLRQNEIKLSSFLLLGIGLGRKSIPGLFGQFIGLSVNLLGSDCEQVLNVLMDQCLDLLVTLDRFDVLKVDEDEGQRGQHHRQSERKNEPEPRAAFSF